MPWNLCDSACGKWPNWSHLTPLTASVKYRSTLAFVHSLFKDSTNPYNGAA